MFAKSTLSWSNSLDMEKILIVIGNAGGGHISCAKSVEDAIKKVRPNVDIKIVDLYLLGKFTQNYDFLYYLISRFRLLEKIFNLSYWLVDRSKIFSDIYAFFSVSPLYSVTLKMLKEKQPTLVICNNALTAKVVGKCKKEVGFKYVITVPDMISVSRWFADPNADLIFAPTKKAEGILKTFDSDCNVVSSYYPLREVKKYAGGEVESTRERIFEEYGFKKDIKTVLITGCGFATREIVMKLIKYIKVSDLQFIILTGKDEGLKKVLSTVLKDYSNVMVNGYTISIFDLFAISDVIIAKPGPATLLEIERLGKKAIFTRPVGYQEWGNVEYLLQNPNFVYVGKEFSSIPEKICALMEKEVIEYESDVKDADGIVEYMVESGLMDRL